MDTRNTANPLGQALMISKIGEKSESYSSEAVLDEFECDYLISACWMMRYDIYNQLGGLDEKIFYSPEDVEYCMRARSKGYKIVHLKKAKIIHLYQNQYYIWKQLIF